MQLMRLSLAACLVVATAISARPVSEAAEEHDDAVSEDIARSIERAAPEEPLVEPARPRKVLVYGRLPTHADSVAYCSKALAVIADLADGPVQLGGQRAVECVVHGRPVQGDGGDGSGAVEDQVFVRLSHGGAPNSDLLA